MIPTDLARKSCSSFASFIFCLKRKGPCNLERQQHRDRVAEQEADAHIASETRRVAEAEVHRRVTGRGTEVDTRRERIRE